MNDPIICDNMLSPARFEEAYSGTIFLPLETPGLKLILPATITAEVLPVQKALKEQRDTLIAG